MEKKTYALLAGALLLLIVSSISINQTAKSDGEGNVTDWREVRLTDVNSGENYRISELDKPVLVENFAVWCPTCTRQQVEIKDMLENREIEVSVVSLNTDPNEDSDKIRTHAGSNSFDWRYSVAPSEMTNSLRTEYSASILNPPLTPKILVCESSSRRLEFGVKNSDKLAEEIKRGC